MDKTTPALALETLKDPNYKDTSKIIPFASRFTTTNAKRHDIRHGKRLMTNFRVGIGSFPGVQMRSVGYIRPKTANTSKEIRSGNINFLSIGAGYPSVGSLASFNQSVTAMSGFMHPFVSKLRPLFAQKHSIENDEGDGIKKDKHGGGKKMRGRGKKRSRREIEEEEEDEQEEISDEREGRRYKMKKSKQKKMRNSKKSDLKKAKGQIKKVLDDASDGMYYTKSRKIKNQKSFGKSRKGMKLTRKKIHGAGSTLSGEDDGSDNDSGPIMSKITKRNEIQSTVRTGAGAGIAGATSGTLTTKMRTFQPTAPVEGFSTRKRSYRLI